MAAFSALRFLAAVGPGPLEHDPGEVRSRAQELLSRPPYAAEDPGLVGRLLRAIGDRFAALVQGLLGAMSGDAALAWVILVVGVLILSGVVWRVTRGATVDRSVAEVVATAGSRSAAEWHEEADRHEAAGAILEALRCRYSALVATLTESGTLDEVPGRTVREFDAEVAVNAPKIAADVAAAGRSIEGAVYGRQPATRRDLEVVTAAARHAGSSLGSRRAEVRA